MQRNQKDTTFRFLNPSQFFREFSPDLTRSLQAEGARTNVGPFPDRNLFAIMRIEEVGKFLKFPIPIGRSTVYEVCWMKEGKMVRTNGLVTYTITKNNICFWRAGAIKGTESLSKDAKGFYCLFDKDFVLQFLRDQKSLDELPIFRDSGRPVIELSAQNNSYMAQLLEQLEKEFLDDLTDRHRMLGLLLCQLLVSAKRLYSEPVEYGARNSGEQLAHQFLDKLKSDVKMHQTVQFYAGRLNVTPNYLNKCVKTYTGKPATFHITTMIVLEAKILLKQTSMTISEIAARLGFEDVSYFTRVFRKNAGMTPKSYRDPSSAA